MITERKSISENGDFERLVRVCWATIGVGSTGD